ncbi:MAG: ferredoxin [Thermodesulfobacteriota bacterium]
MKKPDLDLSRCSLCGACEELCPEVFQTHPAGYMETAELDDYPENCVDQAIALCPGHCLSWVD